MGALDNPSRGEFEDVVRRLRAVETQSPFESSSVTNGRVRFIGGLLRVEAGGRVEIVGTFDIEGSTTLSGPWNFTGDGTIAGDVDVTGELTVNGPWSLNGDGDITGDVDLQGILSVIGGGRIAVGTAMQLTPAVDGGAIVFQGDVDQKVFGNGSAVGMRKGTSSITVGDTLAGILVGSRSLNVSSTGYQATNMPTISRASANNAVIGTVWSDTAGNLYRVVA